MIRASFAELHISAGIGRNQSTTYHTAEAGGPVIFIGFKHVRKIDITSGAREKPYLEQLSPQFLPVAAYQAAGAYDSLSRLLLLDQGLDRFFHGRGEEGAGIDDDQVRIVWILALHISAGRELLADILRIYQIFGASQADDGKALGCISQ